MKRLFVCPAVILLALAVCCSPAAVENNGERTAVMTARKILTLADEVTLTFNVLDGKYSQASVLEDVAFTAKAYPKALAAYENENGASVVMMPEDCYSIGTVVVRKMETSGEIVVRIDQKKLRKLSSAKAFLLPLKLESNNPAMKLRDYTYVVVPALGGSDECVRAVLPSTDGYADIYYSDAKDNTDCIVYFPGGGFANHTPGCISQIVDYCKGKGITLAIVMYRLPNRDRRRTMTDCENAIEMMLTGKAMLGGYSKLGVMGESAGGYLAALMSAMHPKKIDFQIDCYPVISMDPGKTHTGSMTMFLGTASPSQELIDTYSVEKRVTSATPPAYVAYSIDDDIVKPNENSHAYCEALRKAGVPVKEIPHETGGHHWGQWQDFPASMFEWIASFHAE